MRITRELWFENTAGPRLDIGKYPERDGRVMKRRIHDTKNLAKFAVQLTPALDPGRTARISYSCKGGRFVADHYWRQAISMPTHCFRLHLRQASADRLVGCRAVEESAGGVEVSSFEDLTWRIDEEDLVIDLTRRNLEPNQSITLYWDIFR